jgi:hypothetical protein
MEDIPVSKQQLIDCRLNSDKKFAEIILSLDGYHEKMDKYINRRVKVRNGITVEKHIDDLMVDMWEMTVFNRDMSNFWRILKRWKWFFIGIGILIALMLGSEKVINTIVFLKERHII